MTTRTEIFSLPWPPSANNSKMPVRMGKAARMVSTPKLRAYHAECLRILDELDMPPMEPPYTVQLELHPPTKRKFDLANFEKAPVDALVKSGLISDDCHINRLTLVRGDKFRGGRVIVTITDEGGDNGQGIHQGD